MEKSSKRIGVLTSGGDGPGMNAAIRAVVRAAALHGYESIGIERGYQGLLNGDVRKLGVRDVGNIIQLGGTVLYTARCPAFLDEKVQDQAVQRCKELGLLGLVVIGGDGSFRGARALSNKGVPCCPAFLDEKVQDQAVQRCKELGLLGLVVIGGDGSFRGARALSNKGVPCIGVPGTIDNDIASTEYTIGFDTAINTVIENVDRIRDTSQSHDRCSVVEVMGRHAGHIALHAAVACGAIAVLIPEREYNIDTDIIDRMKNAMATGKQHFIVVVAEGVGNSEELTKYIEQHTGIETRLTVLGYIQRGGTPTAKERVYASVMGYRAVELLAAGKGNRVVAVQNNRTVDFDINEALAMKKHIDDYLYKVAAGISM